MQWFPRLKRLEWLILLATISIYLVLTLTDLTKLPLFVDEALYLRWSQIAGSDASWRFISLTDGKQPLYIWFVIPFMRLISDPLAAGRTASAVAGLGTVLGLGYLGWLLRDKRTGFLAMVLALTSPYLFFYYRFGIMESLLVAMIIWVCIFAVLLAKTRRLDIALLLGMLTGLALLVKSSALFFLLMIPLAYLLAVKWKSLFSQSTLHFLFLVLVSWFLAAVIYNVQRLSPWMHMIGQKNAFFIVSYREIFADPGRLLNNFLDVLRWQWAYTTLPVLTAAAWGIWVTAKQFKRQALLISAWLFGPLLGTVALARLFAPRYIIFITPFILLLAATGLAGIKPAKLRIITLILVVILPLYLIARLHLDPIHFPYVKVDEGYVNGWSAGNGTLQIADWAVERIQSTRQPMTIFTEGTFGILPHGLELYADGRVVGLTIRGLYPLDKLPPPETLESVAINPETYLILNNTLTEGTPAGLELIAAYAKRDPLYSMRLYRVLPVSP